MIPIFLVQADSSAAAKGAALLTGAQFLYLTAILVGAVVLGWVVLCIALVRAKRNRIDVIQDKGFLSAITVVLIISAVLLLTLTRQLSGEIAGTLLSGVAGYVLGSLKKSAPPKPDAGAS